MSRSRIIYPWVLIGCSLWATSGEISAETKAGWGMDAVLSRHVDAAGRAAYVELLRDSSVHWLRDRGTGGDSPLIAFKELQIAGHAVLVMAQDIPGGAGTEWGAFPSDLRLLWLNARDTAQEYADVVDAWELHNEPELAWWPDMPDRYAAHAKALYLGLKAGARAAGKDTPVLLGALGLPPGPWLERSARNGLLPYADAWNVHYYGDSSQFTGFLDSHVQAMRDLMPASPFAPRPLATRIWPVRASALATSNLATRVANGRVLPIWATEVGVNTVTPDTWADPVRRQRQADWIVSTASQARAHPHTAVFMPFVLVHKDDGYALTESATKTWPAWDAYARYTRENPFPDRPAFRPSATPPLWSPSIRHSEAPPSAPAGLLPSAVHGPSLRRSVAPPSVAPSPNPVVLQWLADAETASGHKLAAAYRWRADGRPIRGELRIYNFGESTVSGRLVQTREPGDGRFNSSGFRYQVAPIQSTEVHASVVVPCAARNRAPGSVTHSASLRGESLCDSPSTRCRASSVAPPSGPPTAVVAPPSAASPLRPPLFRRSAAAVAPTRCRASSVVPSSVAPLFRYSCPQASVAPSLRYSGPPTFRRSDVPTSDPLTVPPGGMVSVPLSFALEDAPGGGLREWRQFSFVEENGRRSELGFALERSPDLYPAEATPLPIKEWGRQSPSFAHVPHAVPSGTTGPWQTINGVRVLFAQGAMARFKLGDRPFDSEYPSIAAASLPKGLPGHGWLRVAMRELGPAGVRVRVDLVDKDGRRFTQWENLGHVRGLPFGAPRWMNLMDFHPYAWGKLDKRRHLRPSEVREVQLRFFAANGPTLVDVELGFATDYGTAVDPAGEVHLAPPPGAKTAPVE